MNIFVPEKKKIISSLAEIAGEFMFRKFKQKPDGSRVLIYEDDEWRPNLITNLGMNIIGSGSSLGNYLQIGTGTTTPAFTDTALAAYYATSSALTQISNTNAGAPNYETVYTHRFDFAAGVLNGTYTEIGVTWSGTGSTNNISTRALILDASGNPTSITVNGPDEILQVTYRMTWYPPLADVTGSITIDGSGTHAFTARPFAAGTTWFDWFSYSTLGVSFSTQSYASNGSLADKLATTESGTTSVISGAWNSYVNDSYSRGFNMTASIDQGNLSGGISMMYVNVLNGHLNPSIRTQVQFSPAIPKTSAQSLTIPFSISWARHA